jgi:hypothetical protein
LSIGLLATALHAQVAGPVSGFVFDRSARVLRPIAGIPGAATLGSALEGASDLAAAYISPRQDLALLFTAEGGRFVRLNGSAATPVPCDGVPSPAELAVFSPSGSAAAVYAAGRAYVFTGLPDSPALSATVQTGALSTTRPQARGRGVRSEPFSLAVSDDGRYLLLASGRSVRLVGMAGESATVMDTLPGAVVAFAPAGHDAAVADARSVTLLRNVRAGVSPRILSEDGPGRGSVAGIAFAGDGSKLFVVNPGSREIGSFDITSGVRTTILCACEPEGLAPMGTLFRLNDGGAGPVWLLDNRNDEPRTVFVPARSE